MTEDEFADLFHQIRKDTGPVGRLLLDSLERLYIIDRARLVVAEVKADQAAGILGHRVFADNDRHSRRATDLKAV